MVPTYLARWHPEGSAVTRSALGRDYCMQSRQLPQSKKCRAGGQCTVDSSGHHLIYHKRTRYPKDIPNCTFDSGLLQLNPGLYIGGSTPLLRVRDGQGTLHNKDIEPLT